MTGSGPLLVVLGIAMVDSPCACTSLRHAAAVMMFFSVGGEDKDSTFFVLMQYFILV